MKCKYSGQNVNLACWRAWTRKTKPDYDDVQALFGR